MLACTVALSLLTLTPACMSQTGRIVMIEAPRESASGGVNPISFEPLYATIISRAENLRARTQAYEQAPRLSLIRDSTFQAFITDVHEQSADVMRAHLDLKARGTDNDLKCILKGVSLDLDIKAAALANATDEAALTEALRELDDLLSDNIDVIRTLATANSGMDCVIEFGAGA